jgi:hypothetical protein
VTRISYIAVPPKARYAAFRKESRMKFVNATNLDRKFGAINPGASDGFGRWRTLFKTSNPNKPLWAVRKLYFRG